MIRKFASNVLFPVPGYAIRKFVSNVVFHVPGYNTIRKFAIVMLFFLYQVMR